VSTYYTSSNHAKGNVTMMMTTRGKHELVEEEEKLSPKVKVISELLLQIL
jgi:hypothetical protein